MSLIKFENPKNGRFYYLSIDRDLLDDLVLTVVRGGRSISICYAKYAGSFDEITQQVDKIKKIRLRRGYQLVS